MRIHILRHGQSLANASHIVAGQQESPLSEQGELEARAAGTKAISYDFDAIVSSPMGRAYQTALIVAEAIGYPASKITVLDNLRERHLGILETKRYDETPYGNGNGEEAEHIPDIEPLDHFSERVGVALETIEAMPAQSVLVVCHNGTGRMLQVLSQRLPLHTFYAQPRLANATFYPLLSSNRAGKA